MKSPGKNSTPTSFRKASADMAQFIAFLTLSERMLAKKDWNDADETLVMEHFARLQRFAKQGKVIMAGRTQDDPPVGLVLFYAESLEDANDFIEDDPAVMGDVMRAVVRPYKVAVSNALLS
ncbi:MAG TPA: hypothetical protein DCP62_02250 [Erysipelotrichaceae bacterium]|nr:hypothetical protein [Erysipelotrichaceae bacterium]HAO62237.1 hypothetical protein [Erysipelotrichaceae bacterium]HBZ41828.1 hypothetical protein [Erysipelotrichaceae bacterium]